MVIKSVTDIVQSMLTFFSNRRPSVPVGEGTPTRDIVIDGPSQELGGLYSSVATATTETSVQNASIIGLTTLGQNLGLPRKPAIRASNAVTFFSRNAPASDVLIPANSAVATTPVVGATPVQFTTLESATMFAANAAVYLNPVTQLYELSIPIQAVVAGAAGNVGANTINTLSSTISGIDGCYNPAETSGGEDIEDLELYRLRIAQAYTSSGVGTEDGYMTLVKSVVGVTDAAFVGHGLTGRDAWGAVDIYIKGETISQFIDVVTSLGPNIPPFVLSHQPVAEDQTISLQSSSSGSLAPTLWTLVKDTGNYGGSIYAQDMIQWPSGNLSLSYGSIIATYYYNSLVSTVQNLFTQTNEDVQNVSVLVKAAEAISIDLTAYVKILPGFTFSNVEQLIQTSIISLFAGLSIGAVLQQADIVTAIRTVPGVADVKVPLAVFRSTDGTIVPDSNNNLELPANGTATPGNIVINPM